MPGPVSVTTIRTSRPRSSTELVIPMTLRAEGFSFMASAAFTNRFSSTCWSWPGSPRSAGTCSASRRSHSTPSKRFWVRTNSIERWIRAFRSTRSTLSSAREKSISPLAMASMRRDCSMMMRPRRSTCS